MPTKPEERREYFRRIGSKGGKRSLKTMTKAARTARAYKSGKQSRKVDHEKVLALRERRLKWREITERMWISMASVARLLRNSDSASRPSLADS